MARHPHAQANDIIYDDAYDYAAEEGIIRWIGATYHDPGYWEQDLDVDISPFRPMVDEDTGLPGGDEDFEARVAVSFHNTIILERDYRFYTNPDGRVNHEYEDV